MNAPTNMTAAQTQSYAAFLSRFAGRRRGSLADWLRQAAQQLLNQGGFYDQF